MPKFTLKNQVADLFPSAYLSELLAAKQIVEILGRNPGVSLDIVDLHTNPLPRCNIGIARNAGVGYLLSRYPNLQQIVMADGDTQPTPYHGQIVRENILRPLFHGPRLSLCPAPFEETLKIINRNYYVFEMFRHFREAVVMKDASVYHESDFVQGKVTLQRATTANTANMSNESVE